MYTDGDCSASGYEWTNSFNFDSPFDGDGDFEFLSDATQRTACLNPTGIRAFTPYTGVDDWPIHIDYKHGFWCINNEQPDASCFDYQVQYCCPKSQIGSCDQTGYAWSAWQDEDDG